MSKNTKTVDLIIVRKIHEKLTRTTDEYANVTLEVPATATDQQILEYWARRGSEWDDVHDWHVGKSEEELLHDTTTYDKPFIHYSDDDKQWFRLVVGGDGDLIGEDEMPADEREAT